MEGCLLLARLELLSGGTDAQAADMNLQTICKLSEKLYFFLEGNLRSSSGTRDKSHQYWLDFKLRAERNVRFSLTKPVPHFQKEHTTKSMKKDLNGVCHRSSAFLLLSVCHPDNISVGSTLFQGCFFRSSSQDSVS